MRIASPDTGAAVVRMFVSDRLSALAFSRPQTFALTCAERMSRIEDRAIININDAVVLTVLLQITAGPVGAMKQVQVA